MQLQVVRTLYRHAEPPKATIAEKPAPALPVRLLRLREVSRLTGLAKTSIYDGIRKGTFPAPIRLTSTARAWRSDEIELWIAARTAERDAGAQL